MKAQVTVKAVGFAFPPKLVKSCTRRFRGNAAEQCLAHRQTQVLTDLREYDRTGLVYERSGRRWATAWPARRAKESRCHEVIRFYPTVGQPISLKIILRSQ